MIPTTLLTSVPTLESSCGLVLPTIDIHCHTTNRPLPDTLEPSATLDTILKKMYQYNISRTCLLASYFPHKQSGISNYRLAHWINNDSRFALFGSLDFEHYFYQGFNELEELAAEGTLKGIKIYTCYQNIELQSEKMKKVGTLAQTYSLPLMFHSGYSYSSMRTTGKPTITTSITPLDIEPIAQSYNINVIISHLSKPFFSELINVLNRNQNIYTDTSGLIDSKYDRDEILLATNEIKKVLTNCGPEKVLFGTDFPVQTHEDSFFMVEHAMKDFSQNDKNKVYGNNARRLLQW